MNDAQKESAEYLAGKYKVDPKVFIKLLGDFIVPAIKATVSEEFHKLEKAVRISERIKMAEELIKSIREER